MESDLREAEQSPQQQSGLETAVLSDFDGSRSLHLSVPLVPAVSLSSNTSLEAAVEDGIVVASVEERKARVGV